jgi:predicted ABC-class ATPase
MRHHHDLGRALEAIDGRGYRQYKSVEGAWRFDDFVLHVDHVQGDPFAAPTRIRLLVDGAVTRLPPSAYASAARATGTAAYLARGFSAAARETSRRRGTGRSGEIRMMHPGQLALQTTALRIDSGGAVEARCTVGLPADGRRIAGSQARRLLLDDVPTLVRQRLFFSGHDPAVVERHAATNEDAVALRAALGPLGLVAFVGDGARLPRSSGVDDRPLASSEVVPFRSPESLRITLELPNHGPLEGMGIPEGVTLVVGGGFHGKSTLLRALQDGVYNHRPDDGRECVVTRGDTVKIRAEDGRSVAGVDISGFIDGLPLGRDTSWFSTSNASGSTSQAAAIVEALEAGASTLLIDEDTSATNFMIRDRRMQALVPADGEPITPFVDRARELFEDHGVSTILVVGGSGDYLDVADLVIRMTDYLPEDVTTEARGVARDVPTGRASEASSALIRAIPRVVERSSIDASTGRRTRQVRVPDGRTLLFGKETVDLGGVEQLVLEGQLRAIGEALAWIGTELDPGIGAVPEILEAVAQALAGEGLDAISDRLVGDLAAFRSLELASTLNRLRSLRVRGP